MNVALIPLASRLYFWKGLPENGGYGELAFCAETSADAAANSNVNAEETIVIPRLSMDNVHTESDNTIDSGVQRANENKNEQERTLPFTAKLPGQLPRKCNAHIDACRNQVVSTFRQPCNLPDIA
jgi:hypothetical protein